MNETTDELINNKLAELAYLLTRAKHLNIDYNTLFVEGRSAIDLCTDITVLSGT